MEATKQALVTSSLVQQQSMHRSESMAVDMSDEQVALHRSRVLRKLDTRIIPLVSVHPLHNASKMAYRPPGQIDAHYLWSPISRQGPARIRCCLHVSTGYGKTLYTYQDCHIDLSRISMGKSTAGLARSSTLDTWYLSIPSPASSIPSPPQSTWASSFLPGGYAWS